MEKPKYPEVHVKLVGKVSGNAYAILAAVSKALQEAGISKVECAAFLVEATAEDYDHLLQTPMRWVDVE